MSHMNGQLNMNHTCAARENFKSVVLKRREGIPKYIVTEFPDDVFGKRLTLKGINKTSFICEYGGEIFFVPFMYVSYLSIEEGEQCTDLY